MNVQCTLDGETVNVVGVTMNGTSVYITYVYSSQLLTKRKAMSINDVTFVIGTGASIV